MIQKWSRIKGIVHLKWKFHHHLLSHMLFQMHMTDFLLCNIKYVLMNVHTALFHAKKHIVTRGCSETHCSSYKALILSLLLWCFLCFFGAGHCIFFFFFLKREHLMNLSFTKHGNAYRFGATWGSVNDDRTLIFGWIVPLRRSSSCVQSLWPSIFRHFTENILLYCQVNHVLKCASWKGLIYSLLSILFIIFNALLHIIFHFFF